MPRAERTILSTRQLPAALLLEAAAAGFRVECLSFIETTPIDETYIDEAIQRLARERLDVLFTSMNAVEVVAAHLPFTPDWRAWSIGSSTKNLVEEKLGLPVAGDAPYAERLADVIIAAAVPALTFFCGNQRRDTLPEKLRSAGIRLEELVVYQTVATPHRLGADYDALLFFSPSAVESFASMNELAPSTVYFAIGTTTADALRLAGAQQIVTAAEPGKEALLKLAIEHFRNFTTT